MKKDEPLDGRELKRMVRDLEKAAYALGVVMKDLVAAVEGTMLAMKEMTEKMEAAKKDKRLIDEREEDGS